MKSTLSEQISQRLWKKLGLEKTPLEADLRYEFPPARVDSGSKRLSGGLGIGARFFTPPMMRSGPPSRVGALAYTYVGHIITETTLKELGVPVNPHLFRDCAVYTVAINAGVSPSGKGNVLVMDGYEMALLATTSRSGALCLDPKLALAGSLPLDYGADDIGAELALG